MRETMEMFSSARAALLVLGTAKRCANDGSGILCSGKSEAGAGMLIPGLPNEVALMILVRLPLSLHGLFRAVSCAWRDALQPSTVIPLRNSLHVAEMWAAFLFKKPKWKFVLYDPLLQRFSAPITPPFCSSRVEILGATNSRVLFLEFANKGPTVEAIHCFDAESMNWRPDSTPPWPHESMPFFQTTDGFVWVVGGSDHDRKASKRVVRLDVRTMRWETMPRMHHRRIMPVVVVLEGRLCVIGGHTRTFDRLEIVPSGEMWDPTNQKWMLEPELWPSELLFWAHPTLRIAVVLDTLYAVMSINGGNVRTCYVEIMHYESSFKRWISLGNVPISMYSCGSCAGSCIANHVIGVGEELWVVLSCFWPRSGCTDKILSCVPGARPPPLLWRTLPLPSGSSRFIGQGVVHV